MTQQPITGDRVVTDPISGKDKRVYISDGARIEIVQLFDKEILTAHKSDNEPLRLILCRIKGDLLCR
jgi:hypothetical protein